MSLAVGTSTRRRAWSRLVSGDPVTRWPYRVVLSARRGNFHPGRTKWHV